MASRMSRPQPLSSTPKQVSAYLDEMDPIAWNIEPSPEDLALLNIVELDQEELARLEQSETSPPESSSSGARKRAREEEDEENPQERKRESSSKPQDGGIPATVSQDNQDDDDPEEEEDLMVAVDHEPRVSRRRHKKLKGSSCPKRPLGAYGIFYHQERQRIVESLPQGSHLSEDDIQRQVGRLWRALSEEDIKKFDKLAEEDKARYHQEMAALGTCDPESPKNIDQQPEKTTYFTYDFPPPPPGVTVIPAHGGSLGSDAAVAPEAVAAAAGMKEATPSTSPVPTTPRWGYLHGPPPMRGYPSPVPSAGPHVVQSSPYTPPRRQYYPPPSPRSWPPSPFRQHQLPPPPPRYSPDFARAARPGPAYPAPPPPPRPPHHYSIPPGMELALPDTHGREKKYKVTYRCYRMRAEDVQGFLESMRPGGRPPPHYQQHHQAPPPPPQPHLDPRQPSPQPSYGPRW